MKYAIVKLGGKQLKVTEGETFQIEKQPSLDFDVLAYSNGSEILLGSPILNNIKIKAEFTGEKLSDKVVVARFKAKSRYKKKRGHRQLVSIIKVTSILKDGDTATEKAAPKAKKEKVSSSKTEEAPKAVKAKRVTKKKE